jgi:DNA-binding response OmpR family regulator
LEDNQDTRELVIRLLQAEGYQIVPAGSIAEALFLIREGRPEMSTHGCRPDAFALYIVDEKLPDGNGIEFIRRVRELGDSVPILVHSAAAFQADIEAALEAGANDYVVKPNGWTRLVTVVNSLVPGNGATTCVGPLAE